MTKKIKYWYYNILYNVNVCAVSSFKYYVPKVEQWLVFKTLDTFSAHSNISKRCKKIKFAQIF